MRRPDRTFWIRPAACGLAAIVAAFALTAVDRAAGDAATRLLFPGPPEGARSFLGAVITAMISFTGLVFSITVVVLVLTSGQFSPRVLRQFLRDRAIQWSLGLFIATFVYALFTLREVQGTNTADAFVPRIAVTGSFLLVLASVAQFIYYIHHIIHFIQVSSIIRRTSDEARRLIEVRVPREPSPPAAPLDRTGREQVVVAPQAGPLLRIDEDALVRRAERDGVGAALAVRVGDFVPVGASLMTIYRGPSAPEVDAAGYARSVTQGIERSMDQDLAFGFRQLVDIAIKALSPSINDPTTCAQAVDALHDLLRRLVTRPWRPGRHGDRNGVTRLEVPSWSVGELVVLTVEEIAHFGADMPQIPARLARMLDDLADAALPEHREAVAAGRRAAGLHG
ncbi:putative membrane protein [Actinomycetospora cinnamomea]|uniref:Putative membrane protein n=1 Tax=Actinomycetospora cinnamomea TaxID=663609 RepID=A0A2U1FDH0_9PSEU|nr:putative membrane protein [Actinomycetospora cinnamomea]